MLYQSSNPFLQAPFSRGLATQLSSLRTALLTRLMALSLIACMYALPLQAQSGNALDFDGVNDYVSFHTSGLPMGNSPRTIELRMKTSSSKLSTLFSYGLNPGFNLPNLFMMMGTDGKINWVTGSAGGDLNNAGTVVNDDQWHHIAFTYDGSTMKIYVDGNLDASKSSVSFNTVPNGNASSGAVLGAGVPNNQSQISWYFDGQIDDLRIWSYAKSASQVQNFTGDASKLLRAYNFDQGVANGSNPSVTALIDQQGGQNGTLSGFALQGTSSNWVGAGSGQSISCGSGNNEVKVSLVSVTSTEITLTVEAYKGGALISQGNFNLTNGSFQSAPYVGGAGSTGTPDKKTWIITPGTGTTNIQFKSCPSISMDLD